MEADILRCAKQRFQLQTKLAHFVRFKKRYDMSKSEVLVPSNFLF